MGRLLSAIVLAVSVAGSAASVSAQEYSDSQLVADCSAQRESLDAPRLVRCLAYLAGINDAMVMILAAQRVEGAYCPPTAGATGEQLRQIVIGWYVSHPRERGVRARTLAVSALLDAFPCPGPEPTE